MILENVAKNGVSPIVYNLVMTNKQGTIGVDSKGDCGIDQVLQIDFRINTRLLHFISDLRLAFGL